jgi:hypothetical protein
MDGVGAKLIDRDNTLLPGVAKILKNACEGEGSNRKPVTKRI